MSDIQVLSVTIHPSYQYLLCCTTEGFQSYSLNPFKSVVNRLILGGIRFGFIETKTGPSGSIPPPITRYWITGTGRNSTFPNNRVVVWNDTTNQPDTEISINTPILSFKLIEAKVLAILCARKLFIYDLPQIKLRTSIDINYSKVSYQLVGPDPYLCYQPIQMGTETTDIFSQVPRIVHQFATDSTTLRRIAMSNTGNYIATVSYTGVVLKLFKSGDGQLLQEFRRGITSKNITYLGFSSRDQWLICGTDEGSVHLFSILTSEIGYTSVWGFLRQKSKYCLHINHPVDEVYVCDSTNQINIISGNKYYRGSYQLDNCQIETSQLLVHQRDPFSVSPKIRKMK